MSTRSSLFPVFLSPRLKPPTSLYISHMYARTKSSPRLLRTVPPSDQPPPPLKAQAHLSSPRSSILAKSIILYRAIHCSNINPLLPVMFLGNWPCNQKRAYLLLFTLFRFVCGTKCGGSWAGLFNAQMSLAHNQHAQRLYLGQRQEGHPVIFAGDTRGKAAR